MGLAVGGAEESLLSKPGTFDLVLKKRQGFIRIALQSGDAIPPCSCLDLHRLRHATLSSNPMLCFLHVMHEVLLVELSAVAAANTADTSAILAMPQAFKH